MAAVLQKFATQTPGFWMRCAPPVREGEQLQAVIAAAAGCSDEAATPSPPLPVSRISSVKAFRLHAKPMALSR